MNDNKTYHTLIKYLLLIIIYFASKNTTAQTSNNVQEHIGAEIKGVVYTKQYQVGGSFNTNGYSINYRLGKIPTSFYEKNIDIDIALIRHPKDVSRNSNTNNGSNYSYGKLNSLYTIRVGYGENREIADKIDVGSIEINYHYYAGISFGLVKPVYLEIETEPYVTEIEKYNPYAHNLANIYGGATFTKGFSEITFYPGIYTKFGLNFDYSKTTTKISTIETGIIIDYFINEVPIMAKSENYNVFLAFYLSFNIGKKWN